MENLISIPQNTDLNKINLVNTKNEVIQPIEKEIQPKLETFRSMMQKSIATNEIFNTLLEEMQEIDFEMEAVGPDINIFREQLNSNLDFKTKESIERKIEKFSPNNLQKYVIIIEKLLSLAQQKGFDLGVSNEDFYYYDSQIWKKENNQTLFTFLGDFAKKSGLNPLDARQVKTREILLKQFQADAIIPDFNASMDGKIPLENGVLIIENENTELTEFKPEYFLKYKLPFKYDPEAKAPLFKKTLDKILPDSKLQDILFEGFGSVFTKELNLEKMIILHGSGSNGKSVIHNVINALYGSESVTNHSLQSLCDPDSRVRASIENTLINFSSEIGSGKFDIDTFKQLISNEPVYARVLYKDPYKITNYGRFVFNGNTLPSFTENTDAFYRRFIIIPFNVTISDAEKDPYLSKKIISDELPGVFNLVLEGMRRLLKQKSFTKSEIVDDEIKKYRKESSSILSFLDDENFVKSSHSKIPSETFHMLYKDYCQKNGFSAFSSKKFNAQLRVAGFNIERSTGGYYYIDCEKSIPTVDDTAIIINLRKN